ncbi:integrin alpha-5-like [Phasianus colchicus]|uniref:integrin alpha-5-like n=1 Tax=Phasianus colchicus TaxID=9054 RepID=UPI00129DAA46|nr:integrin alpha-5-like [Phasianus colchicus]
MSPVLQVPNVSNHEEPHVPNSSDPHPWVSPHPQPHVTHIPNPRLRRPHATNATTRCPHPPPCPQVVNEGPSAISHGTLELSCPLMLGDHPVLYIVGHSGPRNCSASHSLDRLQLAEQEQSQHSHALQRRDTRGGVGPPGPPSTLGCPEAECFRLSCPMGGLEKQQRAILHLSARLWARSFLQREVRAQALRCDAEYRVLRLPYRVRPPHYPSQSLQVVTGLQWARAESSAGVPVWVVVLAVLLGLLLLALLSYGLYKLGFFKRSVPYGTAMEKAQLKPQAASEA